MPPTLSGELRSLAEHSLSLCAGGSLLGAAVAYARRQPFTLTVAAFGVNSALTGTAYLGA